MPDTGSPSKNELSPSERLKDLIVALQAWPNAHIALSQRIKTIITEVEHLEKRDELAGSHG